LRLGVLLAVIAWAALAGTAFPQPAAAVAGPDKPLAGTASAGISLTSGNTDTINYSIGFDMKYDAKGPNVMKWAALLLRGKQNGILAVDRTSLGYRDQYALSARAFVFGQADYLRDTFKQIDYLVAPTAGAGYKVVDTKPTQLSVDGGVGAVSEKDTGLDVSTSGAVTAGEQLVYALTSTATLKQSTTNLWKTSDVGDSLHTFSIGLSTKISDRVQVSIDLLDTFKNRPPTPATKKNDVAVVAALSAKF
jgi:putative salt-induced outer membrane protein YdiY